MTPPMGWMAWETFRCEIDCDANPTGCINEALFLSMTDALVDGGFAAAGYNQISIDDCWLALTRNEDGVLEPNATRFPNGLAYLSSYMHQRGVRFGLYSDIGTMTCAKYPGDQGSEELDAQTFASWGVDYLKVDGCYSTTDNYQIGYPKMGAALQATGRDIVYSCSWPAYLTYNESQKPFAEFIDAGCNLWRNYDDVQNHWGSVANIIDHFGNYSQDLQKWAGPGHWHDMDMILAGSTHFNDLLTPDQARTQFAIWSIMASPLFLSADLRAITPVYRDIILNPEVIAINQDPLGLAGARVDSIGGVEWWMRKLSDGCTAVVLYNKNEIGSPYSLPLPPPGSGLTGTTFRLRNLFERKDHGVVSELFSAFVPPTGVIFLKVCENRV
eukprot:c46228_g1_i1.p1 GENE.c46228_g1_i1~~c46228_g1_i1.p1  ORF type:complete len:436 (+),score=83.99 c46228_g1_i1:154-1308(+)